MNNKIKIITAITILSLGSSTFAADSFKSNQGLKLDKFEPSLFYGQWNIKSGGGFLKEHPSFINISKGDRDSANQQLAFHKKNNNRTEKFQSVEVKDKIFSTMYNINQFNFINKNYNNENVNSISVYELQKQGMDNVYKFIDENESNNLLFSYYSDNSIIKDSQVYGLFDFRNNNVRLSKFRSEWDNIVYDLKKKKNFDLKNGVDFFFLNDKSKLMAIDVVNETSFILYDVLLEESALFEKSKEEIEVKTYNELFKELEAKNQKEKDSRNKY